VFKQLRNSRAGYTQQPPDLSMVRTSATSGWAYSLRSAGVSAALKGTASLFLG
jgi:hypothetical protein